MPRPFTVAFLTLAIAAVVAGAAQAHGVSGKDAAFVAASQGPQIVPFLYLGAKHMVTGYDHLLFILGVIFFVRRMKHIALYVTLFSAGHSLTLLLGVLGGVQVNPFLVDAVIGLSVAYKAFDNLSGFRILFGMQPDSRLAILAFGWVHGLGLATKLQALKLSPHGLVINLVSFNVGVEVGQLLALSLMLLIMFAWRASPRFDRQAVTANVALMAAGFGLFGYQLVGFLTHGRYF